MKYAAFLRAVNVGGRSVAMAELRAHLGTLGFEDVKTILQSGTAIFAARKRNPADLERSIENHLRSTLRLEIPVIVRTGAEIAEAVAGNPFVREAETDPARLHAFVFKTQPKPARYAALQAGTKGRERVVLGNGVLYAFYPDGMGESKLTAAVIDRALETAVTARNWNTMRKICDALSYG